MSTKIEIENEALVDMLGITDDNQTNLSPDDNSPSESPIKKYQTDICLPLAPPAVVQFCPTCIPKPDWEEPWDWRDNPEPFLNEKTCEYQIPVIINEDGETFTSKSINDFSANMKSFRKQLKDRLDVPNSYFDQVISSREILQIMLRSYVLPGIRLLLRHYDKMETDDIVCTFPASRHSIDGYSNQAGDAVTGCLAGAGVGSMFGPFGALLGCGVGILVESSGDGFSDEAEMQAQMLKQRCLTIYQIFKSGLIDKKFFEDLIETYEFSTGEPNSDPGTYEMFRPNVKFLLAMNEILNLKDDEGERTGPGASLFDNRINIEGLELYGRVADYDLGRSPGEPIRVLVAIPAYVFDAVPQAPTPEALDFNAVKEVELEPIQLYGMISRLAHALKVYGKFQAYWWQTERATLYKSVYKEDGTYAPMSQNEDGSNEVGSDIHDFGPSHNDPSWPGYINSDTYGEAGDQSIFYIFNQAHGVKNFFDALKKLIETNGYTLSRWNIGFGNDNPEKIRIVFDEADGLGYFKIASVHVKPVHCDWRKLTKGLGDPNDLQASGFLNNAAVEDRTICGYIANINQIDTELQAKTTPPWLDFIVKYTYPPLIVKYQSDTLGPPGSKNPIGCIIESAGGVQGLRDWIFDEIMSMGDAILYQFNKNSCKLIDKRNQGTDKANYTPPAFFMKKEGTSGWGNLNPRNWSVAGSEYSVHKQRKQDATKTVQDSLRSERDTIRAQQQSLKEEDFRNKAEYNEAIRDLNQQAQTYDQGIDKVSSHPTMSLVYDNALKEFDMDSSLLGFFIDEAEMRTQASFFSKSVWNTPWKAKPNEPSQMTKFLSRLDLCGLTNLALKAVQCLMGGVTLEAAYAAIIKATLESMDFIYWDELWVGLPIEKQLEITELIGKELGSLPPPWKWAPGEKTASKKLDDTIKASSKDFMQEREKALTKMTTQLGKMKEELEAETPMKPEDRKKLQGEYDDLQRKYRVKKNTPYTYERENTVWGIPYGAGSKEEINLTAEDIKEIKARAAAWDAGKRSPNQNRIKEGTFGKSFGKIQKVLMEAYLEAIMEVVGFEYLLSWIDTIPGAKFIANMIANWDCPYPGMFNPPVMSFMATLTLDTCGENRTDMKLPKIMDLGNLKFMNLINVLVEVAYKAFWKSLTGIMVKLLVKVLRTLETALCKALELAGRLTAQALKPGAQGGFMGALVDTFCGEDEGDESKQKETALNLLQSIGVSPKIGATQSSANIIGEEVKNAYKAGAMTQSSDDVVTGDRQEMSGGNQNTIDKSDSADIASRTDLLGSYDRLINTLNLTNTKNEYKSLFVNLPGEMDQDLLARISRTVSALHPEWAPIFKHPANVAEIFAAAGNLLSPSQRQAMKNDLNAPMDDYPIEETICLTNAEKEQWDRDRIELFSAEGVPQEIAEDWIAKQNEKVESDLLDAAKIASKGINGPLKDAIDELMNLDNTTSDCEVKSTALAFETDTTKQLQEDMAQGVWKALGQRFMKDLVGGGTFRNRNGVVDHILSDKTHTPLRTHEIYTNWTWVFPNWNHTQQDHELKYEIMKEHLPDWWVDAWMQEDVYSPFPETVGLLTHDQLLQADTTLSQNSFDVTMPSAKEYTYTMQVDGWSDKSVTYIYKKPKEKKSDFVLKFRDRPDDDGNEVWDYGFNLKYKSFEVTRQPTSSTVVSMENFNYNIIVDILTRTQSTRQFYMEDGELITRDPEENAATNNWEKYSIYVETPIEPEVRQLISTYNLDTSKLSGNKINYQGLCFHAIVDRAWKDFQWSPDLNHWSKIVFNGKTQNFYDKIFKMLIRPGDPYKSGSDYVPRAFKFGYSTDTAITFKDLLYVSPSADPLDEGTWSYDHKEEEKVLGKSATENPRVHFLDPAVHGGWYSFPKIYVEPADFEGMMKLIQVMIPQIDGCQPKKTDFLNTGNLADIQKETASKIPPDPKLAFAPECVIKKPFDLIVPSQIHGYIHATIVATIRTYLSEFILKSLPTFGILDFNLKNYDDLISKVVVQNMQRGMKDQTGGWWLWSRYRFIKRHVYYWLFLEQCAQIAMRRYKDSSDPLFGDNEEVKELIDKIYAAKSNYKHIDGSHVDELINATNITYKLDGTEFKFNYNQYNTALNTKQKAMMRMKFPADSIQDAPEQPWYRQIQYGIGLIEHGPDFMKWTESTVGLGIKATNLGTMVWTNALVTGLVGVGATLLLTIGTGGLGLGAIAGIGAFSAFMGGVGTDVKYSGADNQGEADEDDRSYLNWDWKPHLWNNDAYKETYRQAAKIYTIWSVQKECEALLAMLVGEQTEYYAEIMSNSDIVKPEVADIVKFYLGAGNGIMKSDKLNSGKTTVEIPLAGQTESGDTVYSYGEEVGDVSNVNDQGLYSADPNYDNSFGNFFLQKYIRLVDRSEFVDAPPTEIPNWVKHRPFGYRLKGVVNINDFVDYYNQMKDGSGTYNGLETQFNEEQYISELFGNLEPLIVPPDSPEDTGLDELLGSTIGFRFGVRLMYRPPSGGIVGIGVPSDKEQDISNLEKAYYFADPAAQPASDGSHGKDYVFPLVSYERDVIDKKLKDVKWDDPFLGEDLRCYIDNLIETPECKLLFDHVFPMKRCASITAMYIYNGFFPSIGKHPDERTDPGKLDPASQEIWQEDIFADTHFALWRMFKSYYETKSWNWSWDFDFDFNWRQWFKDLWPSMFTNLDSTVSWWQKWRVQKDRPFDKDGKQCESPFAKFM
tara:strand:+ start:12936 stop:21059 length:8124 start_codon:yes stop_codon:yes gene_type:complete